MGSSYAEINLDENPVIVPLCGHLLTIESMDGHMQMAKYFEFSSADPPWIEGLKSTSKPFEAGDLKGCPLCRMPLRNINRYGRIVKRAFIDEATKKFIIWANSTFVPLTQRLANVEEKLGHTKLSTEAITRPDSATAESIQLKGDPDFQIGRVNKLIGKQGRYKELFQLRSGVKKFLTSVRENEQPFSRIYDLVQDARARLGVETEFDYAPEVLQTRNRQLATVLLLLCDHLILLEFLMLFKNKLAGQALGAARVLDVDFTNNRKVCHDLIAESLDRQQPANVVEGQLFWARFVALERGVTPTSEDMEDLLIDARFHLSQARNTCAQHPGQTKGMLAEVEAVETMLKETTFYATVTNEEKAAVYAAMASEFTGTGHW